jgi:hypothetical protein
MTIHKHISETEHQGVAENTLRPSLWPLPGGGKKWYLKDTPRPRQPAGLRRQDLRPEHTIAGLKKSGASNLIAQVTA